MIENQILVVRKHVIELSKKGHFESIQIEGAFVRGLDAPEPIGNFEVSLNELHFTVRSGLDRSIHLDALIKAAQSHRPFSFALMRLISKSLFCDFRSVETDWRFEFEILDWGSMRDGD